MNVAILGASAKPERYSYKALKELSAKGFAVFPVNPALKEIEGIKTYASLGEIEEKIDTVTVYLSPERSAALGEEILSLRPRRVIFNPGAENPGLADRLRAERVEALDACTLVMLRTGEF